MSRHTGYGRCPYGAAPPSPGNNCMCNGCVSDRLAPDPPALNLRYLLEGTPIRMRWAMRWATSRVSFPESVAEHSYFVCLYSMMVAWWVCSEAPDYVPQPDLSGLMADTLMRAVVHDIEEARSGDVHRPFKHSTPELQAAMANAAKAAATQTLKPLISDYEGLLRLWENSKDTTWAGRIVRFADLLAVFAFVKQEPSSDVVKWLCLDTLRPHFEEFHKKEYDFIRPLVREAAVILEEILDVK